MPLLFFYDDRTGKIRTLPALWPMVIVRCSPEMGVHARPWIFEFWGGHICLWLVGLYFTHGSFPIWARCKRRQTHGRRRDDPENQGQRPGTAIEAIEAPILILFITPRGVHFPFIPTLHPPNQISFYISHRYLPPLSMSTSHLESLYDRIHSTLTQSVIVYTSADRVHFDAYPSLTSGFSTTPFATILPELRAHFAVQITGPHIQGAIDLA